MWLQRAIAPSDWEVMTQDTLWVGQKSLLFVWTSSFGTVNSTKQLLQLIAPRYNVWGFYFFWRWKLQACSTPRLHYNLIKVPYCVGNPHSQVTCRWTDASFLQLCGMSFVSLPTKLWTKSSGWSLGASTQHDSNPVRFNLQSSIGASPKVNDVGFFS